MPQKSFRHRLIIYSMFLATMSFAGCGCFWQQMKGETPPPPSAEPAKVAPPEQKVEVPPPVPYVYSPILECSGEYLVRGTRETKGYGLYSYVLLPTRATMESNKRQFERYAALHKAYASALFPIASGGTQEKTPIKNQNITYWPLNVVSYSKIRDGDEWFVTHYDYERAKFLMTKLRKVLKTQNPGPFIVSTRFPLISRGGPLKRGEGIVIDLSRISQNRFETVLRIFQAKIANDPDRWNPTFDHAMILTKCISAVEIHGLQVLEAMEFIKRFFISEAEAGTKAPRKR